MIYSIYSPYNGRIEKILAFQDSYVYEWEKLFMIRTTDGDLEEITVGISGDIIFSDVTIGQKVNLNTKLCEIKDDMLITGSD
jgi:hypothetical protein